ncbi:MAG: hypothetical protein KH454_07215, partial [Eggerthella sp.]|nr:hypothetical protein [Eggerthella sp.]
MLSEQIHNFSKLRQYAHAKNGERDGSPFSRHDYVRRMKDLVVGIFVAGGSAFAGFTFGRFGLRLGNRL